MTITHPKKLNLILILLIFITFSTILFIFIGHKTSEISKEIISQSLNGANISLNKIHHVATREGIKEWSLDAKAVKLVDENKKAYLTDISLTFFMKDGKDIHLTAKEGILQTQSNDMEIMGNIIIKNTEYQLNTESLHYDHKKRIISSNTHVKCFGRLFNLNADSMHYNLNTKKTMFQGNVEGNFSEKIS